MNYKEFAKRIKEKYPDYADMDDLALAKAMVAKFPEDYKDISFEGEVTNTPPEPEMDPKQRREELTGYWKSQLFPESAEAFTNDESGWDRALAGVSDVATLPGRFFIGGDDMNYTPEEAEGFRQRIASDRSLLPLAGLGAVGLPVKAGIMAGATKFGAPARVLTTIATGAAEGAGGSVASDLLGGRDISPLGMAIGAGTGGLLTAPSAGLRQARVGHIPDPQVAELAYKAGAGKGAMGAKGLDAASEKVLSAAKDIDLPKPEVLAKAQDQISDVLKLAEDRAKELRRSNRITAADFKAGTDGRKAVVDNLMAEGTWLTPEALMREARRVRQADPDLAMGLEKIAASRLWDATQGRALDAAFQGSLYSNTLTAPQQQRVVEKLIKVSTDPKTGKSILPAQMGSSYNQSLGLTAGLPNAEMLQAAQRSGAAASELVKGLPGGKLVTLGHMLEGQLPVPAGLGGEAMNEFLPYRDREYLPPPR